MKTKRHRSLSCLCFEPEFIDSNYNYKTKEGSVVDNHDNLKKKKVVYPTKPPKIVSDVVASYKSLGGCKNDNYPPPPPIVNRIFKVVMFQSYLKKKLRNRKVLQDPIRSDSSRSYSSLVEKIPDTRSQELKSDSSISNSTRSSLSISSRRSSNFSFSSSNSSNSSSHSRSKSVYEKKSFELNFKELKHSKTNSNLVDVPNSNKKGNKSSKLIRNSTTALCLLLVSLLVLIFWGKICAILCTSTFVYFAPSRKAEEEEVEEEEKKSKELPDIESKEYRKRVIMDGFLERNHNRFESETKK